MRFSADRSARNTGFMKETARRALVATLVVGGLVVIALALWKLKLSSPFLAFIIAAAIRPGVDLLHEQRVPRDPMAARFLGLVIVVGLLLLGRGPRRRPGDRGGPRCRVRLDSEASESEGFAGYLLLRHRRAPRRAAGRLRTRRPGGGDTVTAFEIAVGSSSPSRARRTGYFERGHAQRLVLSLLP